MVREEVWRLADDAAGLCVRFVTDSRRIAARWTLARPNLTMDHMAATAIGGLDLYGRTEDGWRWAGLGRLRSSRRPEAVLAEGLSGQPREYMLYLPLYNGVRELSIGLDAGATLRPGPPRPAERARPIVVYGTSIVQGACASRPGMAYPAILGRRLDRPLVNLGFSGNARMEPELADLLAETDAAVYVLDALPNMTAVMVRERAGAFVGRLAERRPGVPIVLVEGAAHLGSAFGVPGRDSAAERTGLCGPCTWSYAGGSPGGWRMWRPARCSAMTAKPGWTAGTCRTWDSCGWPTRWSGSCGQCSAVTSEWAASRR